MNSFKARGIVIFETPEARWDSLSVKRRAGSPAVSDEADELIERLQNTESDPAKPGEDQGWRRSAQEQLLGRMPAERLADELRRRGWMVIEPLTP